MEKKRAVIKWILSITCGPVITLLFFAACSPLYPAYYEQKTCELILAGGALCVGPGFYSGHIDMMLSPVVVLYSAGQVLVRGRNGLFILMCINSIAFLRLLLANIDKRNISDQNKIKFFALISFVYCCVIDVAGGSGALWLPGFFALLYFCRTGKKNRADKRIIIMAMMVFGAFLVRDIMACGISVLTAIVAILPAVLFFDRFFQEIDRYEKNDPAVPDPINIRKRVFAYLMAFFCLTGFFVCILSGKIDGNIKTMVNGYADKNTAAIRQMAGAVPPEERGEIAGFYPTADFFVVNGIYPANRYSCRNDPADPEALKDGRYKWVVYNFSGKGPDDECRNVLMQDYEVVKGGAFMQLFRRKTVMDR